jgi:hypothetical protein
MLFFICRLDLVRIDIKKKDDELRETCFELIRVRNLLEKTRKDAEVYN